MGLFARTVHAAIKLASWLVLALLFAILFEWAGMLLLWREQGAAHSRAMLTRELAYLNEDFRQDLLVSSPVRFAARSGEALYHYAFEVSHAVELLRWIEPPPRSGDTWLRVGLHKLMLPALDYLAAAMSVTELFGVRLAVLLLSAPVFALFGLVGITEGLVRRDLRRWGGGWESSFVYHHAKRLVLPLPLGACIVYLCVPLSVHPNVVILPAAMLFALVLSISAATFKKYL